MMSLLAFLTALAIGQSGSTVNYLGKTPEQVVKMGQSGWMEYSLNHTKQTNADMRIAGITYGEAMMKVNDKAMAHLPKARQGWLLTLRKSCRAYMVASYDLGMSISTESQLWSIDRAGMGGDIEELIRDCIAQKHPKGTTSSSFTKDFKAIDVAIKTARDPKSETYPANIEDASQNLKALKKAHEALLKTISKGAANDKVLTYSFMHSALEIASGKGPAD